MHLTQSNDQSMANNSAQGGKWSVRETTPSSALSCSRDVRDAPVRWRCRYWTRTEELSSQHKAMERRLRVMKMVILITMFGEAPRSVQIIMFKSDMCIKYTWKSDLQTECYVPLTGSLKCRDRNHQLTEKKNRNEISVTAVKLSI